jgi:hypothetical protein
MDVRRRPRGFGPHHIFTKRDVRNRLEDVVKAVNRAPGPRVAKVEGKGYGLFADRAYEVGEEVTSYGGVDVPSATNGSYVVSVNEELSIDGEYGFMADEKGRWINDPQTSAQQSVDELRFAGNVELEVKRDERDESVGYLVFVATRPIEEREELLWYYGPEYERPWLPDAPTYGDSDEDIDEEPRRPPLGPEALLPYTDVRRLVTVEYINARFRDSVLSPGEDVAQLLRLAKRNVSLTPHYFPRYSFWRELRHLLDTRDDLWHIFWVHDFGRLGWGEVVPGDWIDFADTASMPWRRCYEWNVFFQRRCLKELGWLRGRRYKELDMFPALFYELLPFGAPGSLFSLSCWSHSGNQGDEFERHGYAGASDLVTPFAEDGTLPPSRPLDQTDMTTMHPAAALWKVMRWSFRDRKDIGVLETTQNQFYLDLGETVENQRPPTLATRLGFAYVPALWAYCFWYMMHTNPAILDDGDRSLGREAMGALRSLPPRPMYKGMWFVGQQQVKE